MNYLSVCSGIEAATVAWESLGFKAIAFSEIDAAASAVLAHHYPDTPNWGDMTRYKEWPDATVDVLVGGTPCQSFSVAGLRKGLADPRGNLMLTYLGILDRYRPRWMVWENVPGVLSSTSHDAPDPCEPPPPVDMGCDSAEMEIEDDYASEEIHAFNSFLAGLSELGYGWAYRSLDAQYFHLAQRRERVFVVGCLRDWRGAAEILFERESLQGYPPPRRETGQGPAGTLGARTTATGGLGTDFECDGGVIAAYDVAPGLTASGRGTERTGSSRGQDCQIAGPYWEGGELADTLDASNASNASKQQMVPEKRRFQAIVCPTKKPVAFTSKDYGADAGEISPTLRGMGHDQSHANGGGQVAVAFDTTQITSPLNRSRPKQGDPCHPLNAHAHPPAIALQSVNTPREKKQNGLGVSEEDVMYTLSARDLHGVDFSLDIHKSANDGSSLGVQEEHINAMRTDHPPTVATGWAVRRLTPRECERLQGFPDDYTLIPFNGRSMADGPRYKMLGNSMAVPVMRWIGQRINDYTKLETRMR